MESVSSRYRGQKSVAPTIRDEPHLTPAHNPQNMVVNIERLVLRIDGRVNFRRAIRPLLRSQLLWRASAMTFGTAVVATTGSLARPDAYLESTASRMGFISHLLSPSDSVLEFGSGLGGNLIGIAFRIKRGYGVDINPGFTKLAQRLARSRRAQNIAFVSFDGRTIPSLFPINTIMSIGVFERIPKNLVIEYLSQFRRLLPSGGRLVLYFLTTRAIDAGFGRVLGKDAYVPWEPEELSILFDKLDFSVASVIPRFLGGGDTYIMSYNPRKPGA